MRLGEFFASCEPQSMHLSALMFSKLWWSLEVGVFTVIYLVVGCAAQFSAVVQPLELSK